MASSNANEQRQEKPAKAAKVKWTRKGGPRSKTGCITCRLRRVKCDEKRPACNRCTSSRRKCEGFPSIFATSKPWEVVEVPSIGSMIKPSMNPRVASNDHAMQSFRFFERETVPILSEVFGKDLWTVTLPRAAMHCPLIWNAAVALGSAHESHYLMTRGPGLSQAKLDWTFEQYNRAIRSFASTHAAGKRDDKAAIVASILFMVFEVSRSEFGKAIGHAKSGINMFREYRRLPTTNLSSSSSGDLIPCHQLEQGLRQMEVQLCELTLDDEAPLYLTLLSMFNRNDVPIASPPTVALPCSEEFNEVRLHIQWFWHSLMDKLYFLLEADEEFSVICQNAISDDYMLYHDAIHEWLGSFASVSEEIWPMLNAEQQDHFSVLGRYGQLFSMAVNAFGLDLTVWDWHTHLFEQILEFCRPMIARYKRVLGEDNSSLEANCVFNGNNGFVVLIFHVFWRCRSARVRHMAVQMLQQYPRRDFSWDSPMVLDICRHIDQIERGSEPLSAAALRGALPEEIPSWTRVRAIGVKFNYEQQSSELSYVTSRSAIDCSEVVTKRHIPWGGEGVFG